MKGQLRAISAVSFDFAYLRGMLLRLSEFEHHFSESSLKKGLQIFRSGRVEATGRVAGEQLFNVSGRPVTLRKRGNQVLSATCSCRRSPLCEHLCAVLFSFQQHELGIVVVQRKRTKSGPVGEMQKQTSPPGLRELLLEVQPGALYDFIIAYAESDALFRQSLLLQFGTGTAAAEQAQLLLERLLLPFSGRESLNQKQMDQLAELIDRFYNAEGHDSDRLYRSLAILSQVPRFFGLRLAGNESRLLALLDQAVADCRAHFETGMDADGKAGWVLASERFLAGAPMLYEPVAVFLLFKTIAVVHTREHLRRIKKALDKKSLALLRTSGIDRLAALRLAVVIREAKLFNAPFAFKRYHGDPALLLARAELLFNDRQADQAFDLVQQELATADYPLVTGVELYNYLFKKALELHRQAHALLFLEKVLVLSPQIHKTHLQHFIDLTSATKQKKALQQLAARIRQHDPAHAREKLVHLWLLAGEPGEMVKELSGIQNKFGLVHRLARQSGASGYPEFQAIYVQHLGDALIDARYTNQQKPLFLQAQRYLDTLPRNSVLALVAALLQRLKAFEQLCAFISGLYPHASERKS